MPDQPRTLQEQLDAVSKEYGQYVAVAPIDIDGARAFNVGHAVPASHVKNGLVPEDSVAKVGTKAADAAPAAASPVSKG